MAQIGICIIQLEWVLGHHAVSWTEVVHGDFINYLLLDKMAAISQTIFSYTFSWMKIYVSWSKFLRSFFTKFPIDNNPVLALIMAWRRIGDKPLSEPVLIRFLDAYIGH